MTAELHALLTHARHVDAHARARLGEELRERLPRGSVLLETCHRVELYGEGAALASLAGEGLPAGTQVLSGDAAARHLLRLAVGRESVVVAEDQLLHQLRTAIQHARARAPLPASLDRLFDLALRAGRRARSWLPSRRRTLADLALERVIGRADTPPRPVLIIGAGEMARRAAQSLAMRGASLLVASRTPERAAVLATEVGGQEVPFDPGADVIAELDGVVVALAGEWLMAETSAAALRESRAWIVDLSAPPALPAIVAASLDGRLVSIDDLADAADSGPSDGLLARLDALVDGALAEYLAWSAGDAQRQAARALTEKAAAARSAELDALWQRAPDLDEEQRREVERMARHLAERLLRDPLERLNEDADGRHADAARELFRL